MNIHKSVTHERIMAAAERGGATLDDPGICLACGADAGGCEPDARGYECEACGEAAVYGAEELAMAVAMDAPRNCHAALLAMLEAEEDEPSPQARAELARGLYKPGESE